MVGDSKVALLVTRVRFSGGAGACKVLFWEGEVENQGEYEFGEGVKATHRVNVTNVITNA